MNIEVRKCFIRLSASPPPPKIIITMEIIKISSQNFVYKVLSVKESKLYLLDFQNGANYIVCMINDFRDIQY